MRGQQSRRIVVSSETAGGGGVGESAVLAAHFPSVSWPFIAHLSEYCGGGGVGGGGEGQGGADGGAGGLGGGDGGGAIPHISLRSNFEDSKRSSSSISLSFW